MAKKSKIKKQHIKVIMLLTIVVTVLAIYFGPLSKPKKEVSQKNSFQNSNAAQTYSGTYFSLKTPDN